MHRRAVTGLLAALAVAGLSACGSLTGSAHAAATVPVTTATAEPVTAAPAAAPSISAVPVVPVVPAQDSGPAGAGTGTSGGGGGSGNGSGGGKGTGGSGPAAPAPQVASLRVVVKPACPVHGTPDAPFSSPGHDVTIAWTVKGASGAALAVDQPGLYGAYGSDYPASGRLQLPFSCTPGGTTSHTYTVWPAGARGISKTITVSARSSGAG